MRYFQKFKLILKEALLQGILIMSINFINFKYFFI